LQHAPAVYGSVNGLTRDGKIYFGWSIYVEKSKVCEETGRVCGRSSTTIHTAIAIGLMGLKQCLPDQYMSTKPVTVHLHIPNKQIVDYLFIKCPLGVKRTIIVDSDVLLQLQYKI